MRYWFKWLVPGLVIVSLLTVLAWGLRHVDIQDDLTARARERLDADGHNWATVVVQGRVAILNGTAPTQATKELALESLGRVYGLRDVVDESGLIPVASPYKWRLERAPGGVAITGYSPSDPVRDALRRVVEEAFPGALIRDDTKLARGAPEEFATAAAYLARTLATFSGGFAEVTDTSVSISGVAPDAAAFETAADRIRAGLPKPMKLDQVAILPPRADPYEWVASRDGDSVTLSGVVPNAEVRETLKKAVIERLPSAKLTDSMTYASGEPGNFVGAVAFALDRLKDLASGSVQLKGRAFTIDGIASTVDTYDATQKLLAGTLPEGLTLSDNKLTPAVVTPYSWSGERNPAGVVLSGYVPSERDRAIVIGAAQAGMPNVPITDQIRVAAGAPKMDWIGAVKFGVDQLSRMAEGSAKISDQTYEVKGVAASSRDYVAIAQALQGTLPASLKLGAGEVIPPKATPYRFIVQNEGTRVIVSGNAPTEDDHQAILLSAVRKFGAVTVVDDIQLASGAPEDFVAAAEAGLQAASRLVPSRVDIVDKQLSVTGTALYSSAADKIKDSIESAMPRGYSGVADISIATAGETLGIEDCQTELRNAMKLNQIAFDTGGSQITPDSDGVLDRLVATVQRCPDAVIEVGGHTDSGGSASKNMDLSKARAQAVVDYLAQAGVLRERMTAVGYGDTRPIASNSTDDGKARNRRIEFVLREP
jgi:OOP family OmpA-OmpF porin